MAFKKIDKEFQVTDSALNVYGFRLLSSGFLVDEFKKNPIGFYLHADADLTDIDRGQGVLVRWEDFRQDGDAWFAKPVINLDHPRGQRTCDEIESGFLNGASVGKIVALEFSEDPNLMLAGQQGPTVTKWFCRELSLVDIPANYNCLSSLVDSNGNEISLADFKINSKNSGMKTITLTPELIKQLNLADNADNAIVMTTLSDLAAKAAKVDTLQTQLTTALTDKETAETNLANLKKEQAKKDVDALLDTALAAKKITNQLKTTLATQYEGKPTELKNLLDAMPAYSPVTEQIKTAGDSVEKFENLSYKDIDRQGLAEELKQKDFELFKAKFKEEYGTEYKG